MFVNVLKSAMMAALFLAVVNESQAQNGARYQMQVRNPHYGLTQWWPHGGGSYDWNGLVAAYNSLPGTTWQYVSYRQVGQQFTPPAVGKTLQQYQAEVRDAYRRAVDARNWAQGNVGRLTQQQFNEVNRKINEFNSTLSTAQQGPYGSSFRSIARLNPIPSTWIRPASEPYGIYYRRGSSGRWTYYQTVNGLSTAQQTCANLRRQYPGYEFTYARR